VSGEPTSHHEVFRDGEVHVLADRCPTCIFRPGNLVNLNPGRVKRMVDGCREDPSGGGNIPCHATIWTRDVRPAICRGFYDAYRRDIPLLEAAAHMGIVAEDPVPERSWTDPDNVRDDLLDS
jgi:hypothetical protein